MPTLQQSVINVLSCEYDGQQQHRKHFGGTKMNDGGTDKLIAARERSSADRIRKTVSKKIISKKNLDHRISHTQYRILHFVHHSHDATID